MDIRRRMLFKKKASSSGGDSTTGGSYTVNLNSQWQLSTSKANPDSSLYEGVYESFSNYNVNSGTATMTITISGYKKFSLYIRSYAESNYDYVMVSQLDKTITGSSSYSDTTLVKAHTRGNQQSGTAISNYTLVEYDNMTGGTHTITIVYRKDGSVNNNDDRGYVLISKVNEGYGTVEPEEPGSGGSSSSINVGDIAYWDGSKVKTVSSDKWSASLGTAIGVVVIPEGFAPDGKVRLIGLKPVDSNGNQSDSHVAIIWGVYSTSIDTSLTNYDRVPRTDNAGSTSTGSDSWGYLPFDKFTNEVSPVLEEPGAKPAGPQSYVDPKAEYVVTSNFIPSPYLGDAPNPEYYKEISGYNNALSDFNGLSNTQTLVVLGSDYQAANACWNYSDGASNLQWYLPAMGELGYIIARFNLINASLTAVGGVAVDGYRIFWSSSEYSSLYAYCLDANYGYVFCHGKDYYGCVRPFATIENNNRINTDDYLTIEALEDGLTASLSTNACEYCVDGDGNWKSLAAGTATESINSGHTLSFRGNLTPSQGDGIGTFTISKICNLKGNCMSMLFGDNSANNYSLSGKRYAFTKLFSYCYNIVNVSENFLPATTLEYYCYAYMFLHCTDLTTAPELPATTLAYGCYLNMFYNCNSLTTAPSILPATTLADYCYNYMFYNCKSLTTAPELPATTLANSCYQNMFNLCTSLRTAPVLPATALANNCYYYMFTGCTKLTYIKMLAIDISASNCLSAWVSGVASAGTFVKNPAMTTLPTGTSGIPSGWTVVNDGEPVIDINNYLTIEAREDGLTASLSINACEYCANADGNWKTLAAGTATEAINNGQTLSFRGNLTPNISNGIGTFTINKKCNLKGNCMSMLFKDNATNNYSLRGKDHAFYKLFQNCTNIVNVSSYFLPATTLADSCYSCMFDGCTSLTKAPELPATTLDIHCYNSMFYNCISLTTAPIILPATTLANYCYGYMFYYCKSLTTAPELPATTLVNNCYLWMFYGCSKLNYIKMLATDIPANSCLEHWVNSVASSGTFVKHPDMTSLRTGEDGIPSGWTIVNYDEKESGGV